MPIRIGPQDTNLIAKVLTASEEVLQPTQLNLDTISAAKDLSPEEVATLRAALDTLMKVRVRRENPVLARVFDQLLTRLKTGEQPQALSTDEAKALVELMDTLSHAENDALKYLKAVGLIQQPTWDSVVVPHRDASNQVQRGQTNKLKWGLLSLANLASPGVAAITLATLVGGPVGAIGAVGVATSMGMLATPKIQGSIQTAGRVEMRTLGMNSVEGKETVSEAVLLARRAAEADVLRAPKGKLAEALRTEVQLADMLIGSRSASQIGMTEIERPFFPMAGDWHKGVKEILEKHEKQPMAEPELRRALYDLRAKVLDPARLDEIARMHIATTVGVDPKGQTLIVLNQVSNLGALMHEQLSKTPGQMVPEAIGTAAAIVALTSQLDPEAQNALPPRLKDTLTKVAGAQVLTASELSTLKAETDALKAEAQRRKPELSVTSEAARKKAEAAFAVLWGDVLPTVQPMEEPPKLKKLEAVPLEGGGFEVTGQFKYSLFFGAEGEFKARIGANGAIDPQSLHIDLGRSFAEEAAPRVVRHALRLLGDSRGVWGADVTKAGQGSDARYDARVYLDGSSQPATLSMSTFGIVDWSSVKV